VKSDFELPTIRELQLTSLKVTASREISVLELLEGWKSHVIRLSAQATAIPIRDAVSWGVDDLIAALHIRDYIQDAVELLTPQSRREVDRWIVRIDNEYRRFTEPDSTSLLSAWIHEPVKGSWWWSRIPTTGPIAQELRLVEQDLE
jgi:hypothetical protein